MNLRAEAALTIAAVIQKEQSLQQHFDTRLERIDPKDRGLFYELTYGTLRQFEFLYALVSKLVDKMPRKKDSDVLALLLVGLYQIHFMRVPDHAALSETVAGAKILKKHWAKNLVNAVLRRFLREHESLCEGLLNNESSITAPAWILEHFRRDWPEHWRDIVGACTEAGPITLRANARKSSREALAETLRDLNIDFRETRFSTDGLTLNSSSDLRKLNIGSAAFTVQDEAAQLAAKLLKLEAGQSVLDACAAPGGKTTHILEREPELKSLLALDIDEQRIQSIQENLDRLQLQAELRCADAAETDTWWDGQPFDRILLDAPCSASGIIRRHPDIKILRRADDIAKLATLQQTLLQNLWQCLKPGGILLYATCSVFKQENVATVTSFVSSTPDAEHDKIDADWGQEQEYGRQLLPIKGEHDGFYYARLVKTIA